MSRFYNFQSYLNTYCTKLKGTPPNYPCDTKNWTPYYAKTLHNAIYLVKCNFAPQSHCFDFWTFETLFH